MQLGKVVLQVACELPFATRSMFPRGVRRDCTRLRLLATGFGPIPGIAKAVQLLLGRFASRSSKLMGGGKESGRRYRGDAHVGVLRMLLFK